MPWRSGRWRESWVAVVGVTLVFFWMSSRSPRPTCRSLDPNKPVAPFVTPFTEKNGVFYWLGTDTRGRDMLSRTIWGCQRVLVWGITATVVAYIVGTMLGLIAGYLGGWWDQIVSFFANVLLSFPVMVLFILILNYLGPSGFNIVIAVTFSSAPADHAHRARAGARREVARLHPGGADRAASIRSAS